MRRRKSSENGDDVEEIYQTELVQLFSEEDEVVITYIFMFAKKKKYIYIVVRINIKDSFFLTKE